MLMAEHLVQGVDVWINTPRRPWEACGTSGMKVLVNGGLNLSELDGWWAEAYRRRWAGRSVTARIAATTRPGTRPRLMQLYPLLEGRSGAAFYARDAPASRGTGSRGCGRAWRA